MGDKWVMGWNHMKQMGINHIALSQPALMKRDANAPDSARLLHPTPAEVIFKDPLWVISPFFFKKKNPPLLLSLVLEAGNRCLKCSSGGLQKDILCSAPLGSLFYSYGGLLLLSHRVTLSECCASATPGECLNPDPTDWR